MNCPENCGDCCTKTSWPLESQDHAYWARLHGAKIEYFYNILVATFDIPCSKYNPFTKKCTIYETRPMMCRTFICEKHATEPMKVWEG